MDKYNFLNGVDIEATWLHPYLLLIQNWTTVIQSIQQNLHTIHVCLWETRTKKTDKTKQKITQYGSFDMQYANKLHG